MHKIILTIFLIFVCMSEVFAYAIKVYDEYGNRVGTYRKEGDNFVLYDFYDKKVDDPSTLIKNAPNQKTLTNYSHTFYDEYMMPLFSYSTGYYGSNGRYYPRGFYPPRNWIGSPDCPSIVRPRAGRSVIKSENTNVTSTRPLTQDMIINRGKATNVIKTGF